MRMWNRRWLAVLIVCLGAGCSPQFQVIQALYYGEFDEDGSEIMYHLENTKNRNIVIAKKGEIICGEAEIKEGLIVKYKKEKDER